MIKYQSLAERKQIASSILNDVIIEAYNDIPKTVIADIISKHHDVKVTDTLVEAYTDLAATRSFTFDPVVLEIRKQNKLDHSLLEHKLEFVLNDSSIIIITEESFNLMQNVLKENYEAIEFISQNKNNFMRMMNLIVNYKETE